MTHRTIWQFTNPVTGKRFNISNPADLPGFTKWNLGTPVVVQDGATMFGQSIAVTQKDSVVCSTMCRRATEEVCICSCGGKNHGVDFKGPKADDLDI